MRHFHIAHNTCLKFPLGVTVVPQEKAKTMPMHFFVQVYLGECENSEFEKITFSFVNACIFVTRLWPWSKL